MMNHPELEPLRVAVLAGGDSPEREISLASGQAVAVALAAAAHRVTLLDPAAQSLSQLDWRRFDVAYIALHGGAGEDGRVQADLDRHRVHYTGSGPDASRLAMSKSASKERFFQHDVPTLPYVLAHRQERHSDLLARIASLGYPLFFKPDGQGSSLGVSRAASPQEVAAALAACGQFDEFALIEPCIVGREFTVAVWERRSLPVLEILAPGGVFDFHAKYRAESTGYRFDHGLPATLEARIECAAVGAAEALGTRGLVRVDLMLDRFDCLWVLEVNTSPGMTHHSLVPKAAARAGYDMPALCNALVREATATQVPR